MPTLSIKNRFLLVRTQVGTLKDATGECPATRPGFELVVGKRARGKLWRPEP